MLESLLKQLQEIDKKADVIIKNCCSNIEERINSKENEKKHSSSDRLIILEEQIASYKRELEYEKKRIINNHSSEKRKLVVATSSYFMEILNSIEVKLESNVNEDEEKLLNYKKQISENNDKLNFDVVKELSEKALVINANVINNKNNLNELKSLEQKLNNVDALSNEELINLFKYINLLNGMSFGPVNGIEKNDIKPIKKDDNIALEEEIKKYLEIAKKDFSIDALNKASELINKLTNEGLKNNYEKQKDSLKALIDEKNMLKKAKELVAKAETTMDKKDIEDALNFVESLKDGVEKADLLNKLNSLKTNDVEIFEEVVKQLGNKVKNNEIIEETEISNLKNMINKVDKSNYRLHLSEIKDIIDYYNSQVQKNIQENYDQENGKKYKLYNFITEPFIKLMNIKLFNKIKNKYYDYKKKSYDKLKDELEEETDDKKHDKLSKKVKSKSAVLSKLYNRVLDRDIVSGVKLYKSINTINKLKPKLYKSTLSEKETNKLYKAQATYSLKMEKGLDKKAKDKEIIEDKNRIINILDQYLDLLSICDDLNGVYEKAINVLDSYKEKLSETEHQAYLHQITMIMNYRNSYKEPYEYDHKETDEMVKYYDDQRDIEKKVIYTKHK